MTAQDATARNRTTDAPHVESVAASRVLKLLEVGDLEQLRDRSKMSSVKQSTDLLIPVIASLAAEHGDDAASQRDLQPALGVALYQSLVRQRLAGRSLDAAIEQLMSGDFERPRALDRSIPRALEAIIMRTLRHAPEERFDDLRALGAALLPFASKQTRQSYGAALGPSRDTSGWSDRPPSVNAEADGRRRARRGADLLLLAAAIGVFALFVVAHRRDDRVPALAHASEPASASAATQVEATREASPAQEAPPVQKAPPAQEVLPAQKAPSAQAPADDEPAPARDAHAAPRGDRVGSAPSVYAVDLTVEPRDAWIMLDQKPAGSGRLQRVLPRDGKAHALHVGAPGFKVRALRFTDQAPPSSVVLQRRAAGASPRTAR